MNTNHKFDSEELEILDALNNNKLVRSETLTEDIETAKNAALITIESYQEVKIELPVRDLQILKTKAFQSGISYQNLITALIHKYIDKLNVRVLTE